MNAVAIDFGTFALSLLVFLLPGSAVLSLFHTGDSWDTSQRLIVALTLSLAFYPLLFLYGRVFNVRLGPPAVWVMLALAGATVIIQSLRTGWRRHGDRWRTSSSRAEYALSASALWLVFALALGVRLAVIADLPVPQWGDSYQHTVITQLLLEHGGLFSSWEPYAPMRSFTYHFGFHATSAVYAWLVGTTAAQAVLVVGQVLNALAALVLYPLTLRLTHNHWAAVGAVLVAGLLSPMPMFYVNWGRYTQLTGLVLLPVLFVLIAQAVESHPFDWRLAGLAVIVTSALVLTHHQVVLYAGLLLGTWLLVNVASGQNPGSAWLRAMGIVLAAAIIVIPWMANVVPTILPNVLRPPVQYSADFLKSFFAFPPSGFLPLGSGFYAPLYLMVAAAVGAVWGLWRRDRGTTTIVVWCISLVLVANLFRTGLPFSGIVDGFSVFITAYIAVACLTGVTIAYVEQLPERFSVRRVSVILLVIVVGAGIGAAQRLMALDAAYTLVTKADLRAMQWIRDHSPSHAKFLVNSWFATGPKGFVAGTDGGWWIPLLAGRATSLPPANYMYETITPEDWAEIYVLAEIEPSQFNTEETMSLLAEHNIQYIYLGKKGGRLNAADFSGNPEYVRVYDADDVTIFAVRRSAEALVP